MTDTDDATLTRVRFYEDPKGWTLSRMTGPNPGLPRDGPPGEYPEWLEPIVAVAKAGGHIVVPISPPPRVIVWFDLDQHLRLVRFIEIGTS